MYLLHFFISKNIIDAQTSFKALIKQFCYLTRKRFATPALFGWSEIGHR